MESTRYSHQILIKLNFYRQILEKSSNIKFRQNPFSGSRVVPCGQTRRRKLVVFHNFTCLKTETGIYVTGHTGHHPWQDSLLVTDGSEDSIVWMLATSWQCSLHPDVKSCSLLSAWAECCTCPYGHLNWEVRCPSGRDVGKTRWWRSHVPARAWRDVISTRGLVWRPANFRSHCLCYVVRLWEIPVKEARLTH